jgi:hypothetical protein
MTRMRPQSLEQIILDKRSVSLELLQLDPLLLIGSIAPIPPCFPVLDTNFLTLPFLTARSSIPPSLLPLVALLLHVGRDVLHALILPRFVLVPPTFTY